MFAGNKVIIGDEEIIIPPISLGQLRNGVLQKLQEHDQLVSDGKTFEAMEIRGKIILSAIQRNYPDFSEDRLFSYLDMGNTGNIWLGILGASGLLPGEAQAAGETQNGISAPSIVA